MSGYKVKRAIIMAAGIGKRMQPLTFQTPKPLIEVNGKRMIDTIIDALLENGIEDINIVTGYLADSFKALISKYPTIINIPGLSDGGFAKGIVAWRSKKNPDLMILNTGNGFVASGLDVNAFLSQYLTKEGRTLRKSRDLAESCKDIMDKFFPISGSALFSKDDSLALVKSKDNK